MLQFAQSSDTYRSRILSGLNFTFILHFLLFSFLPLVIFSVFGYFMNKRIIRNIHAQRVEHIAQMVVWHIQDQLDNELLLLREIGRNQPRAQQVVADYLLKQKLYEEVYLQDGDSVRAFKTDKKLKIGEITDTVEKNETGLILIQNEVYFYFRPEAKQTWIVKPSEKFKHNFWRSPDTDLTFRFIPAIKKDKDFDFKLNLNDLPGDKEQKPSFFQKLLKVEQISVIEPVNPHISLLVRQSTAGMYSELRSFLFDIIVANAFIGIIIIVLAILLSRKITDPIHSLIFAVQKIGKGDLSQPIQIQSKHEIKTLANEFEFMRRKLQESYTNLEAKIEERSKALREAQFQISHQEKMASMGLLAAGIAHEIGNPLTSISSMAQIIRRKVKDEQIAEYLNTILMNINRISKIVRELVDFARPSGYETSYVNVNKLIENAVNIVKYDRRAKRIELQLKLSEELPELFIVADQLLQVFINILINAVDALTEKNPLIEIRTYLKNEFIHIEFQDFGVGIPEENISKIFEPFFTTKKVGKGTGLGLSVSYGIIKNMNGTITVRSKVGEGSTFIIKLPTESNGEKI